MSRGEQHQPLLLTVDQLFDEEVLPTLMDCIRVPNLSPEFDADWKNHGFMDCAVELVRSWYQRHAPPESKIEVLREKSPLILADIPGFSSELTSKTTVIYCHLDVQPPNPSQWTGDLRPFDPLLRGSKLFGRGSSDDKYGPFAALTAVMALRAQGLNHGRVMILIETAEESGSPDMPFYLDLLRPRIGVPDLIICLDSGCGDYDRLWLTSSLRGMASALLTVRTLKQSVHSGDGSGVVPSCFHIVQELLDRIQDRRFGTIILPEMQADIPENRQQEARAVAAILGLEKIISTCPFWPGVRPLTGDAEDLLLNRAWRPALSITGADGLPSLETAGNVVLPYLTLKLSFRLPPTVDAEEAQKELKQALEACPPYGADVNYKALDSDPGWNAPATEDWLQNALKSASQKYYGQPPAAIGEGGSIPVIGMLSERFPEAQFMVVGVDGPESNAHAPNECLDVPMTKKLIACIAEALSALAALTARV